MPSHHRSLAARLLLLGAGVLVAALLAEGGLRIYGAFIAPQARAPGDEGALRVLCVGDSFAYGLGAEDGRGPCEQLEAILEERGHPGGVAAYNRAVPGFNSSQTAAALAAALDEARPDVVVLTVGHNNGWNFAGLNLEEGEGSAGLRLLRALGELRLVKLAQLLLRYDRGDPEPAPDPEVQAWFDRQNRMAKATKRETERERWRSFLDEHPDDVFAMIVLAELAREDGNRELEAAWRREAQARDPAAAERALQGLQRVERWHREQAREGVEPHLIGAQASKADLFRRLGGDEATLEDQRALLDAVLRRDLAAMVAQARDRGAAVIVSGYPGEKPANEVLRESAGELGIPYVDQQASFDALLAREGDPGRWFVLDGHCTSAGYGRIAENLAPSVAEIAEKAP
jgi:lysophospholipase L1-like esterase